MTRLRADIERDTQYNLVLDRAAYRINAEAWTSGVRDCVIAMLYDMVGIWRHPRTSAHHRARIAALVDQAYRRAFDG